MSYLWIIPSDLPFSNQIDIETELVKNREVLVKILEQMVVFNETVSKLLEVSRKKP